MCTINKKSGIRTPKDLEGKKVGLPIYTMSAAVWMKGHLQHDYGVDLSKIQWVEGAINHPGQHGHPSILPLLKPANIVKNNTDKSLSDLLESGGLDAIIGTVLPDCYHTNPDVVRLFPNYREDEKALFRKTKQFPIMHLLALRRDVYEKHPFIASSLFDAMCESKERARLRMRDLGTLNYMLPWMTADIDELHDVLDGDDGRTARARRCVRRRSLALRHRAEPAHARGGDEISHRPGHHQSAVVDRGDVSADPRPVRPQDGQEGQIAGRKRFLRRAMGQ